MPAYNAAAYIDKALASIMCQHGCAFEVIVVDDASSDRTCEIVSRWVARYPETIRLIRMDANSGCCFVPRRVAIEAARAAVIAPLDADDWIEPGYLERLWRRMRQTGAEMVYPTMYTVAEGCEPVRFVPAPDFEMQRVWRGRDLVARTLDGWQIGAGGGLINRRLYLDCFAEHEYKPSGYIVEVLTRHLLCRAPKVALDEARYYYRMQPESVTHRMSPRRFDFLEADLELVDILDRLMPGDGEVRLKTRRQLFHGYFDGLRLLAAARGVSPGERKDILHRLSRQRSHIDWSVLKGGVSPRYRLLARLGTRAALLLLPFLDRIINHRHV